MTLQSSAMHDSLTGLANRALLIDRLRLTLARLHRRPERQFAMLIVDLGCVGCDAGSRESLLLEMTRRLHDQVRPEDTVARLGENVFALLLDEAGKREDVERIAERLHTVTRSPVLLGGKEVAFEVNIGAVVVTKEYAQARDVVEAAEFALAMAKADGNGQHAFAPEPYTSGARIQPCLVSRRNPKS